MREPIHRTRYPELGYVNDGPGLWRIVDLTWEHPSGSPSRIGCAYWTRAELLADLDRFAREFGCEVSNGA